MKRERFRSVTSGCVAVLSLFGCSTPSTSASDADPSTANGSTSGDTKSDGDNLGGSTAAAGTTSRSAGLAGLGEAAGRQSGGGAGNAAGASAAGAGGQSGAFGAGGKAPTQIDAGGSKGVMGAGSGGMSTGSAGTSAGGSTATTPPATWDTVKLVLTGTLPPCNASICHGGNGKITLGFPVKDDAQLYSVLTEYVSKACDNMVLVSPGHPEASALVRVLRGPCSDDVPRMPKDCTEDLDNCVPDEYIAAVEQWVADGAKQP